MDSTLTDDGNTTEAAAISKVVWSGSQGYRILMLPYSMGEKNENGVMKSAMTNLSRRVYGAGKYVVVPVSCSCPNFTSATNNVCIKSTKAKHSSYHCRGSLLL